MASEPVEQLASEADDARARIATTIDAIQDRLDPRRIAGEAFDRAAGSSKELAARAGDVARELARKHPVALGAAGVAIGLALLTRRSLARATVDLGDDFRDYTDYDDGFGYVEGRPQRAFGGDADSPGGSEAAGERAAGRAAAKARALAAESEARVAANPLVSIIVGLAAGAALGALFPTTEAERRVLGN